MKKILFALMSMALAQSVKAEEPFPYQVYSLTEKPRALTLIFAIDENYQLMYFVMKKSEDVNWLTFRENKFDISDNVSYFNKGNFSIAMNLDTFSTEANSTNAGYSIAIRRKGQLVPFSELRHTILEYPNEMGMMASFLCSDISVLPHTIKDAVDFGPKKIKELIDQKKVFLKNTISNKASEALPALVP